MDKRRCSIPDCDTPYTNGGNGYCNKHYLRLRNHGDPLGGNPGPKVHKVIEYDDGTRLCTACDRRLPATEFDIDRNGSSGLRGHCKKCRGEKMHAWYQANRERQRDRARQRYVRDAPKIRANDMARYYRDREKRINLATDSFHTRRARLKGNTHTNGITLTALRKRRGEHCCYCDTQLDFTPDHSGRHNPRRATIEHIIPIADGGAHDWPNITLACHQCNMRKNRMPVDDFVKRLGTHARGALSQAVKQQDSRHP